MTTQVLVEGWRYATNDGNYDIKYNNDLVSATIHVSTQSTYTTTYTELGYEALKDTTHNIDLRPILPMTYIDRYGNGIGIKDDSYKFGLFRLSGNGQSGKYTTFTYKRR